MKTLGLIGGVTWHSSKVYYERINQSVADSLGAFRSAPLILHSLDYESVRKARADGDWRPLRKIILDAGRGLRDAGAEAIVLCSNSLHSVAESVESQVNLPVLHIADALARAAKAQGHQKLALFGTGFTMQSRFYVERLATHNIECFLPEDTEGIDRIINEELARMVIREESREFFLSQLRPLLKKGASAMAMACTEIAPLMNDTDVPRLDTLSIHAQAAATWLIESE